MSNVSAWSTTAGFNNSPPPDGWPEGQARSSLNDCAREMQAALAKWYATSHASLTSAGTSNAYTLTTGAAYTDNAQLPMLSFIIDRTNTGPITLSVDGNTALSVFRNGVGSGDDFASGEFIATSTAVVIFNPGGWFDYIGPPKEGFPKNTRMLFQQTAAPTGWVKDTSSHNNKALRLVTGTASSGGSTAFTSVLTSRPIALANLPVANLSLGSLTAALASGALTNQPMITGQPNTLQQGPGASYTGVTVAVPATAAVNSLTVNIGGTLPLGGSGTAMDFAVQYADAIIATRS